MFNQDETKEEEDETQMEVKINASEYKPEELKVSVQSGQLLVEKARGEDGRRQCLCHEELLQELHPSQGGAGGPGGVQALLRGCTRHHHTQVCTCYYQQSTKRKLISELKSQKKSKSYICSMFQMFQN